LTAQSGCINTLEGANEVLQYEFRNKTLRDSCNEQDLGNSWLEHMKTPLQRIQVRIFLGIQVPPWMKLIFTRHSRLPSGLCSRDGLTVDEQAGRLANRASVASALISECGCVADVRSQTRPRHRGFLLADNVGLGKTAVVL